MRLARQQKIEIRRGYNENAPAAVENCCQSCFPARKNTSRRAGKRGARGAAADRARFVDAVMGTGVPGAAGSTLRHLRGRSRKPKELISIRSSTWRYRQGPVMASLRQPAAPSRWVIARGRCRNRARYNLVGQSVWAMRGLAPIFQVWRTIPPARLLPAVARGVPRRSASATS